MIRASLLFLGFGVLGVLAGWMQENLAFLIVGLLVFLIGALSLPYSTLAQKEAMGVFWQRVKNFFLDIISRFLSLILLGIASIFGGGSFLLQSNFRIPLGLVTINILGLFFLTLLLMEEKGGGHENPGN